MKHTPSAIRSRASRINLRADLPQSRNLTFYTWNGGECSAALQKRDKQVADALMASPLWCASPVRIGDSVLRLRRDHGLPVATQFYTEKDGDETLTFGAYYLTETVWRGDVA